MNYKTINRIKNWIKWPFNLLLSPFLIPMFFFMTDWESDWDRSYFKSEIRKMLMPWL